MYNILIVEDDRTIAALLAEHLNRWDFCASFSTDFKDIMGDFERVRPHLVVLDISLPFYNGYYWCEQIRRRSKVPILFLSSHMENMDIVMAVSMGGDDYITKPFSLDVVVAKINALLRRAYSYFGESQTVEVGQVILNLGDATVSYGEKQTELSKNEQKILSFLMENKNNILSRERIMQKLWDSDSFVDDNTLTVNINRLRRRLSDIGLEDFIITKKGEGYMVHD